MYDISVRGTFHARHAVRLPTGEMEQPHWHAWGVEAVFTGTELDAGGLLVDFVEVQQRLGQVFTDLDGADLNGHAFMAGEPPSTELVARRIFERLDEASWSPGRLKQVTVEEAPGCRATFAPST